MSDGLLSRMQGWYLRRQLCLYGAIAGSLLLNIYMLLADFSAAD